MRRGIALALALLAAPALAQSSADQRDRQKMIEQSLSAYAGSCPCPHFVDRGGRRCGARSAYSRPGGESPLCYPEDISDAMLAAWRAKQRSAQ